MTGNRIFSAGARAADSRTAGASTDGAGWRLTLAGHASRQRAHRDTLFALANGRLGVRGGAEEDGGSGGCFLAEAWQRTPIHYHERFPGFAATTDTRIPVADGSDIALRVNDRQLRGGGCSRSEQILDLRAGCVRRLLEWTLDSGRVELRVTRLVPLDHRGLLAIRMQLRLIGMDGEVEFDSAIRGDHAAPAQGNDPRIGVGGGAGMNWTDARASEDHALAHQATPDGRLRLCCVQRHGVHPNARIEPGDGGDPSITRRIGQRIRMFVDEGETVTLDKFVVWCWDGQADDAALAERALAESNSALDSGFDPLARAQTACLEEFWNGADIAIDGDPEAELALRFNLFHLYQSAARDGVAGTAAKGLTGDGYEGHSFWDTEAFMLPVLALSAPERARAALEFRARTLDSARRHAREMNHDRGALYPWRTIGGDECSGYYPSGSAQYHINAAIAWGIGVYLHATGDNDFLLEHGAEILFETARLWLEAGHFNPRRGGAFCICEVTGPDEYSALVDNNFYTNFMARAHLELATEVWNELNADPDPRATTLFEALALDADEVQRWRAAAAAMYLPRDEQLGILAQDDGFLDKPRWNFDATPADRHPLLLHYHPLTLYRHQVCKQADVVQALIMNGGAIDRDTKARCYDYYRAVTTHDSTLSAGSFAILAAELGRAEDAMAGFDETVHVDLADLHGNSDHGLHMAALAGSWQCLAFGIAGLRIDGSVGGNWPRFAPRLPARWRGWRMALRWRGRRLEVRVDREGAEYRLCDGAGLTIMHHDQPLELTPDRPLRQPLPGSARWPLIATGRPIEALILDLDGVLTDTAELHYRAWKQLADGLGIEFNRTINQRLKGVDRAASLDILLERAGREFSAEQRAQLAERKNLEYRDSLRRITPDDLLPGAGGALRDLRAAGVPLGLASASRNAPELLRRLGISGAFDFIADPAEAALGKPAPDLFLAAAAGLGVAPEACLAVEDAPAGIRAIKAAGMTALGIGRRRDLPGADAVLDGLHQLRIETLPLAGTRIGQPAHDGHSAPDPR